jgi:hypothetical protein
MYSCGVNYSAVRERSPFHVAREAARAGARRASLREPTSVRNAVSVIVVGTALVVIAGIAMRVLDHSEYRTPAVASGGRSRR